MSEQIILGRCVVCGDEIEAPDTGEMEPVRDVDSGKVYSRGNGTRYEFADGRQAGACDEHTNDEVRAAFVTAELVLA